MGRAALAILSTENLLHNLKTIKKLGETRDDAVGEAFDKVARLLKLPYPGGPEVEKLAREGNPEAIKFPRPMIDQKNYDFSFSGLKTSVLYYLRDINNNAHKFQLNKPVEAEQRGIVRGTTKKSISVNQRTHPRESASLKDVAASFQSAAIDVLAEKTLRAAREFKAKSVVISGGVASNNSLRNYLKLKIKNEKSKINLLIAKREFCTDNAAMIGVAGYIGYLSKKRNKLVAQGNLNL